MALVGGAAAWPLVARAQQPAMPVVGFMISSIQARSQQIAAFHAGLKDTGYVQGQNVMVELRSAEGHFDRYPALVADRLRHGVAVLVAVSNDGAIAAKRATTTTPIVFGMGGDPVALGLVDSLSHPGSNITGIYFFTQGLEGKRLGLLHELVPTATMIAVLVNTDYSPAKNQLHDVQEAAARLGVQVLVLRANAEADFDAVFTDLVRQRAGAYRQMGVYAGRILKGEKPADLPIVQSTKFEFVINLSTAKALHIEVPPTLSARADEIIE